MGMLVKIPRMRTVQGRDSQRIGSAATQTICAFWS